MPSLHFRSIWISDLHLGTAGCQAAALLGYTPDALLDEIVDAFAAGDAAGVFRTVDKVIEVGQDPRRFAEDLLRRLRDLIILAAVPDAATNGILDVAADQAQRLQTQVAGLGAGELTRAAEVIAVGLTEMRGTTAPSARASRSTRITSRASSVSASTKQLPPSRPLQKCQVFHTSR